MLPVETLGLAVLGKSEEEQNDVRLLCKLTGFLGEDIVLLVLPKISLGEAYDLKAVIILL